MNKFNQILLAVSFLFISSKAFSHNYFVSTTTMEYDSIDARIEVSTKMTAHDFEHILENKFNLRIHFETVSDTSEIGQYSIQYLQENFILLSGGDTCKFEYLGKEVTLRDELFFHFYFTGVKNPRAIQIKNTLLFTQFTQQQNIVHYKCGNKSKSVTLVLAKPEAELKLE